jgi:hypothetical protein
VNERQAGPREHQMKKATEKTMVKLTEPTAIASLFDHSALVEVLAA